MSDRSNGVAKLADALDYVVNGAVERAVNGMDEKLEAHKQEINEKLDETVRAVQDAILNS